MSRFVFVIVVTVVVAELVARLVASSVPTTLRWYDATSQLKIAQMEEIDGVDVVFAGTSMAWQGLVPATFTELDGRTAYNAGLAGGVPPVMERWLLDEVEPRLSPSIVVWGISSLDLSPSYGTENRERYDDALETRTGVLASVERFTAQYFSLVRDRTVLRDTSQAWGEAARAREASFDQAHAVLGADGERLDFEVDLSTERGAVQQARLRDFTIDPNDVLAIERTIEELRKRGVEVILVEMPVPDRFIASHPNGSADHVLVRQALGSIATLHGLQLIAPDDTFTDNDFVDYTHLTATASASLTAAITDAIQTGRNDAITFAPQTTPIQGATTGINCRLELVVDEYGIATEIEICDTTDVTEATPAFERAATLDGWLESAHAVDLVKYLRDRLTFQTGCDQAPSSDSRLDAARNTLPEDSDQTVLDRAVESLDRMDAACIDQPAVWVTELEKSIAATASFADAIGATPMPRNNYHTDEITERTAMAVAVVDNLYSWVAGRDQFEVSFYWHAAADLRFGRQMQATMHPGVQPETLVVGSSIAARSFDPEQLTADLGAVVLNVSAPGAPPEAYSAWLPDWVETTGASNVVWGLTTHRLMASQGRCGALDTAARPMSAITPLNARQQLFAEVPLLETYHPLDIALGPRAGDAYATTYLDGVLATKWDDNGLIPRTNTFQGVTDSHRGLYSENVVCRAVFDSIFETIADLRSDGIEVTLVLIPQHDDIRALNTGLIEELERVLRAESVAAGVELIELRGPLTDAETYDGVHPNRDGRNRLSSELAASLLQ